MPPVKAQNMLNFNQNFIIIKLAGATQIFVQQIRAINKEKDEKDDAQAKRRAAMPRQVKSRPTSSVRPSPIDVYILSSSSPEHSEDDVILTPELTRTEQETKGHGGEQITNGISLTLWDLDKPN